MQNIHFFCRRLTFIWIKIEIWFIDKESTKTCPVCWQHSIDGFKRSTQSSWFDSPIKLFSCFLWPFLLDDLQKYCKSKFPWISILGHYLHFFFLTSFYLEWNFPMFCLYEVKLPYNPVCPSVSLSVRLVALSVHRSVITSEHLFFTNIPFKISVSEFTILLISFELGKNVVFL